MYLALLAVLYLAFISLGLPDSLLGAGWPAMHLALGVPVSYMGLVAMIISGGTVISSLLSDRLTRKCGTRAVVIVSVFLTAAALLGFSLSTKYVHLLLLAVPYGFGAGAIDAAINNYVALHYTSRHMSWLHCFWGVGAIISPFVMRASLTHAAWNDGYRAVGFLQLGICAVLLATLPLWKVNKSAAAAGAQSVGVAGALKIRGVATMLTGFFAYCALEATTMYWASTYLVEAKGTTPERAAGFASLFYIGITAGRFLCGFAANRLGDRQMIRLGTCVLGGGILLLFASYAVPSLALAGLIVIGFGCAPVYPSVIHSTPDNFGQENSGAIIGIQMASAYIGTTFMPPLFGLLGHLTTFEVLPVFLTAFTVLMIVMLEHTFGVTAKARGAKA